MADISEARMKELFDKIAVQRGSFLEAENANSAGKSHLSLANGHFGDLIGVVSTATIWVSFTISKDGSLKIGDYELQPEFIGRYGKDGPEDFIRNFVLGKLR